MFSFAWEHRPPESPGVFNMQWWYSCSSTFLGWAWLLLLKETPGQITRRNFSHPIPLHNPKQQRLLHGTVPWKLEGPLCSCSSFPKNSFCCLLHTSIPLGCAPREAVCSGCWGEDGNLPRSPFIHPDIFPPISEMVQTAGVKYTTGSSISNWAIC